MMPLARGSQSCCSPTSVGLAGRLVEDGVEDELALLKPPAGEPLDLQEELGAEPAENLLGLRLVALEEERRENALAPGLVVAVILAEGLVDRRAEVSAQLVELRAQLLRGQLLIHDAGELARAEPPQVGGEEVHLGPAQAVAQQGVVGDLLQVAGEGRVVQLAEALEFLAGQPAGARQTVVEVDGQAADAYL